MKRAQILTTEQEVSLLDSFRAGDDEAGAALASGYSPLIEATAHHFYRLNQRFADKQDLISVGFEGFMTALQSAKQRFDCSHGNRLGTYVRPWIHHFIASYIRRERWWAPSIPDRIHRKVVRLSIAERQLRQDLGRQPDIAELAAALSLSPEETRTLLGWLHTDGALSLATPVTEGGPSFGDNLWDRSSYGPHSFAANDALTSTVSTALRCLTPKEEKVLRLSFGISIDREYSASEVAQEFDVKPERIRRIQKNALRKLRMPAPRRGFAAI